MKKLHTFMMRHLRSIMKIRWQDKVTNIKVIKLAGLPSMEDLLIRNNLRWTVHLLRMSTDRLPRQVLYSHLPDGQWFQRLPPARGGTAQRKIFHLANWSQHIHPGPSSSRSRFFMESSQLYAATLIHFSTEPLTTGPDYDPLLLLLALAGDVHPNPGPSTYPCSVCFRNVTSQGTSYLCTRCSHWVHSRCSGLRNAADYRKANGWICTACMTPPQPHTTVERQWHRQ